MPRPPNFSNCPDSQNGFISVHEARSPLSLVSTTALEAENGKGWKEEEGGRKREGGRGRKGKARREEMEGGRKER